jgi:glucose-6-phosphate dehydrogenase assembly protein OpcA
VAVHLTDEVWSARDTSPSDIEAALRELLIRHHAEVGADAPARVLNLIAVVDRQWRGEVENRLEKVGRYHASRTVVCAVEPRRTTIDARVRLIADEEPQAGEFSLTHENVVVDIGEQHLKNLDTIVDPLVVTDLPTMVWAPHGHHEAVDAVMRLSQVVLLDTVAEPEISGALSWARGLSDRAYVVDLAWLRSTPWRERIAATFDPPAFREQLRAITGVHVRHHPDSAAAAVLLCGWLASRLDWSPGSLAARGQNGGLSGRAKTRRHEISLSLEPAPQQDVPGLAGITIETAQGTTIALERGPGGLRAKRTTRKGREIEWTVMGASRGEAGILGEGIRQALLRDPTYRPALDAANAFVS